jgi:spore coat protein CotF
MRLTSSDISPSEMITIASAPTSTATAGTTTRNPKRAIT